MPSRAERVRRRVRESGGTEAQAEAAAESVRRSRTREEVADDREADGGGGGGNGNGGSSDSQSLRDLVGSSDSDGSAARAAAADVQGAGEPPESDPTRTSGTNDIGSGSTSSSSADTTSDPVTSGDQAVENTAGQTVDPVPDRYEPPQTGDGSSGGGDGSGGASTGDGGQGSSGDSGSSGGDGASSGTDSSVLDAGGGAAEAATGGGGAVEDEASDAVTSDDQAVENTAGQTVDPVPDRYEQSRTGGSTTPSGGTPSGSGGGGGTTTDDLLDGDVEDRATPETRQGGVEEGPPGRARQAALELEERALDQLGLESAGAVDIVREGDTLRAEVTEYGQRQLDERAADRIERQFETTRAERAAQQAREAGATEEQAAAVRRGVDASTRGDQTLDVGDFDRGDVDRELRRTGGRVDTGREDQPIDLSGVPEDRRDEIRETIRRERGRSGRQELGETYVLSDEGREQVQEAQLDKATRLIDDQLPTDVDEGDVTRTEGGGYQLSQQGRRELEQRQQRRQAAGEAVTQYRSTEQVAAQEAQDEATLQDRRRQFRQVEEQTAAKQRLREQAAESYSERLGFDVPTSAVDINRVQQDGQTVFRPELDSAEAKAAGRGQRDALSGVVDASEYLVGKYTPFDPDDGGTGGRGNVVNVRRVEQFAGENQVTGGLDLGNTPQRLKGLSQDYSDRIAEPAGDVVAFAGLGPVGLVARPVETATRVSEAAERVAAGEQGFFDALAGETENTTQGTADRVLGGAGRGVAEVGNIPAYASLGVSAADVTVTAAQRIRAGEGGEFAAGAAASGLSLAEQTTGAAVENPAQTAGLVAGGVASGVGVGAVGKRAFTGVRGRLANRGLNFQGKVPSADIERPDVRSGQSQLTRFSERAVPEGDRSMPVEDFPARPASDTAQELRNLASEFDNPQIRQALDTDAGESVLFTARSGVKSERFEPRSGRPYDPDAAFFAGSVARNFLDLDAPTDASVAGGLRRPRPVAALRSLKAAAKQEGTPVIVATAGRVRMFPEDIVSARGDRRAMTQFLEEQSDTGRFYTLRPEAGSGEAEALTAASGASKTNPRPGAGLIDAGDATEFVEVARPFRTEIRGERVPIQLTRPDTGDVTPLSEQRSLSNRLRIGLRGDRGQLDLTGTARTTRSRTRRRTTRSDSDSDGGSYRVGGQPGTPFAPISPVGAGGGDGDTGSPSETRVETDPTPVAPGEDPTRGTDPGTAPTAGSSPPSRDDLQDIDSPAMVDVTSYDRTPTGEVPAYDYDDTTGDDTTVYDTTTYDGSTPPSTPTTPDTPTSDIPTMPDTPTSDIPTTPDIPITDIPTTPNRRGRRFDPDDEKDRDGFVRARGDLAKQFGGGVATDETVLNEDITSVENWEATSPFERTLDDDPSVDVIDVQGTPDEATVEKLEDLTDVDL